MESFHVVELALRSFFFAFKIHSRISCLECFVDAETLILKLIELEKKLSASKAFRALFVKEESSELKIFALFALLL